MKFILGYLRAWWFSVSYYIDSINGNDNNPGNKKLPFRNIRKICEKLNSSMVKGNTKVIIVNDIPSSDVLKLNCVLAPYVMVKFIGNRDSN